ncbi:MAG: S-layer homology domain-containing protein [Clostridia bacterium]|nr:S-layer homology domain-containing protein [Clostridia bacterium]
MFRNSKKNLKKLMAASLVLAQVAAVGVVAPMSASAFAGSAVTRNMEMLDRGVVASKTKDGVLVSWRRLGTEPADTTFTLYRNKEKIAEGAITNFVDKAGTVNDNYTVVANGKMSDSVGVWENGYLDIPLAKTPESDVQQVDRNGVYIGSYAPGDSTYGDLDGDGQYEIIMLWNPSDAKDAATTGRTGKVFVDAYKLDGTHMWRIDMGYNIRAGAHDTMLNVADFDNDGKAEMILRTADGTTDAAGNVVGDASKGDTYENSWAAMNAGKNLQGPLYVTAFDGETGTIIDTIDFQLNNKVGDVTLTYTFGDNFGNRSERYNGTVAYLDGQTPSAVFGRGYYGGKDVGPGRTSVSAYNLKNGKLSMVWHFDSNEAGSQCIGQGNHQIEAGDVDGDGKDEIFTVSLTLDDNGKVLWNTGYGHGDAMHLGDFDPTNEGLEFMKVYEGGAEYNPTYGGDTAPGATTRQDWGLTVQDAKTGKILQTHNGVKDTGRGMIGNIGYGDTYYVTWGAGSTGYWDNNANKLADLGAAMNGRIYWDGDLQTELQDHVTVTKWNDNAQKFEKIFEAPDCKSINGTKGNINAQGDLLGDWREEIVTYTVLDSKTETTPGVIIGDWGKEVPVEISKTTYQYALRVYTTPYATDYNFYTLAHDDIYRNSSGAYGNCYNQPPHISWYMNDKIANSPYTTQPAANVKLVANNYVAKDFNEADLPEAGAQTQKQSGLPFVDVEGHWGKAFIEKMYNAGVINGMDATHFAPDGTVTKGQFATLIVNALKLETVDASGHWAQKFVDAANAANLIAADIAFTEDQYDVNITREEMASMVAKAAAYKNVTAEAADKTFTDDADIAAWAAEDVKTAVALGIINGMDDGSFQPKANATRAQAATMLSQLWDLF